MRIRIVVANQSEARFYDMERSRGPLQLAGRLTDPTAHLHDRDLKSDRPGRVFAAASTGGRRRGATTHHAAGGERRPRKILAQRFARRIATELEKARRQHYFDGIVVIAGSTFLGLLRDAMPAVLRARVAAEVRKDLVNQAAGIVRAHVPEEAFTGHA